MDWNEEAVSRLQALWAEGRSTADIGRQLGITKNAVVGKAHRLKLTARPSPIRRDTTKSQVTRRLAPHPAKEAVTTRTQPLQPAALEIETTVQAAQPAIRPVLVSAARSIGRITSCCWPLGEPGTPTFRFCGDAAMQGRPYCAEHAAIAYVRVRERREDAA